ncbi:DUF397 domain-containing protein [Streptomyces sp. Ncost-T10-10d]|uniref:DUF397 domain-containing protein n=1 Tax=Streptomyces sp. Ncost-T10-10d TaxID=1839774 RepID=UPI0035225C8A
MAEVLLLRRGRVLRTHSHPRPGTICLTESGDPTGAILRTTPSAWAALLRTLKENHPDD